MAGLTGYDSEAVGFDSITRVTRVGSHTSTQTNFEETGTGSQTNFSRDCGVLATPGEGEDEALKEYPPPGLNEFLRKVVPSMLEQLDESQRDGGLLGSSSEEDEDETVVAKLVHELQVTQGIHDPAAGDIEASVLSLSWNCSGNALAIATGSTQHELWCQHGGLIRVYSLKDDKLIHNLDITEKNCVTVVKFHPSLSALLAYGTATGEIVLCNLRETLDGDFQLCSPNGCHGSKRVSYLHWADASLANTFLTAQITKTGKRRCGSDQILVTGGCDGTINVFRVNANSKTFEMVVCYTVNGSRKMAAPDVTCFDFIKTYPLRACDEKVSENIFVVGTKSGNLFLCKTTRDPVGDMTDPVQDVLDGHQTCVLDLAFSFQRPGIFVSVSIDAELRVYDVKQTAPLRIICLDGPVSCVAWLPTSPVAVLGAKGSPLRLVSAANGRAARVAGLLGGAGDVGAVAVCNSKSCRIAAGDTVGCLRIWDLPIRCLRISSEDMEF